VSRLGVQLLTAAVFVLAWMRFSALEPKRESGILPIDPPTPYFRYLGPNSTSGRVLVVHGLDVSKEVMQFVAAALADGGFEAYAIDLPGHGDSDSTFKTELAERTIQNAKTYLGDDLIVLGHSLGAGLLLDLAATEHFSTMVLLAPPPISVSEIRADRVLVATGELDIPRIRSFASIATDVGNPNVEAWILPWGGHSAPVLNPGYIRRVVEWLGGSGAQTRTVARMFWLATMFSGAVAFGVALIPGRSVEPVKTPVAEVLVCYVVACGISLVMLKIVNPVAWIRLFVTDYLIGFLFITGCVLLGARAKARDYITASNLTGLLKGLAAAAFVVVVLGKIVSSHVLHASLSDGRWWRFPFIVLAGLPLFLSDELFIRRLHPRWKSAAIAILTRILLLAFLLTGALSLNREDAFLVLIAPLVAALWLALWFAAGVVHRYTQDPIAAAVFAAIVQGWAFAVWFVTTGSS
jgi:hypothetical protein